MTQIGKDFGQEFGHNSGPVTHVMLHVTQTNLDLDDATLELRRFRKFQPLRIPGGQVWFVLQFDFIIFGALGRPAVHTMHSCIPVAMGNLRLQSIEIFPCRIRRG